MIELKPCPFCGGKAQHIVDGAGICVDDMSIAPNVMHFVWCLNCSGLVSGNSEEEAVNAWNRRTDERED